MQVDDREPHKRARRCAAAMAIGAALGVTAPTTMAATVDSGPIAIAIPNTLAGVYLNLVTGAHGSTGATIPGWDFNPYAVGSGTLLDMFAPNGGSDAIVGVLASASATSLPIGTTIGLASVFVQGVVSGIALRSTATHYVGFRFQNEGTATVNYGYAQVQATAPGGFPATIVRYVYEDSGVPLATPGGPPLFQAAMSRRVHGVAGTFNLPLSISPTVPTMEPRQGPAQSVVFIFGTPIVSASVAVTEGTAVASAPTFSGNTVTVHLTGVPDQQYVTVTLTNVTDSVSTGGTAAVRIGFLAGDVNMSGAVTVADAGQVSAQLAQAVTGTNYLMDINASGTLSLADKAVANASLTHALPPP